MIKIILKHFIYEKCIDVFFSSVSKNFERPNIQHEIEKYFEILKFRIFIMENQDRIVKDIFTNPNFLN